MAEVVENLSSQGSVLDVATDEAIAGCDGDACAAVRALLVAIGRPGARQSADDLFDVLRATSQRRPMGSPTAANPMINESLDQLSLPKAVAMAPASAGLTLFGAVRDRVRLAARDRSHSQLADLFTAPDSVQQIRDLAERGSGNPLAALFARQMIQTPNEFGR